MITRGGGVLDVLGDELMLLQDVHLDIFAGAWGAGP